MFRPTTVRLTAVAPARSITARRAQAQIRAQSLRPLQSQQYQSLRRYATDPPVGAAAPAGSAGNNAPPSGGGGGSGMYIVLAAIVALGAGGYWFLKPVRDVAATAKQAVDTAKDGAGTLGDYSEHIGSLAKSMLPPGAFALYSAIASQSGGVGGFLSNLKDKDMQGVIDEIKKHGGDDAKRIIEKVEKRLKDAKGKVENVDWVALGEDLKKELPEGSQKTIEMFIGKLPDKDDFDQMVKKFKDMGEQSKKEIEASANKILQQVKKAQKDGKNKGDALLKGLKEAAPADIDSLVKQLKDAAKTAGLPADTIEGWLKSKAQDGKINAEETAAQVKDKLKTGAKYIPGEPRDLIEQVKQFSPSVAELLAQAMKEAGIVDDKLNRKV